MTFYCYSPEFLFSLHHFYQYFVDPILPDLMIRIDLQPSMLVGDRFLSKPLSLDNYTLDGNLTRKHSMEIALLVGLKPGLEMVFNVAVGFIVDRWAIFKTHKSFLYKNPWTPSAIVWSLNGQVTHSSHYFGLLPDYDFLVKKPFNQPCMKLRFLFHAKDDLQWGEVSLGTQSIDTVFYWVKVHLHHELLSTSWIIFIMASAWMKTISIPSFLRLLIPYPVSNY